MEIFAALVWEQRDAFLKDSCIISTVDHLLTWRKCAVLLQSAQQMFFSTTLLILMKKPSYIISLTIMTCKKLPLRQQATTSTLVIIINVVDTKLPRLKISSFISDKLYCYICCLLWKNTLICIVAFYDLHFFLYFLLDDWTFFTTWCRVWNSALCTCMHACLYVPLSIFTHE